MAWPWKNILQKIKSEISVKTEKGLRYYKTTDMSKHVSPDDVSSQDAILVAFWWRLPLNHDGLVGAATGNNVLRRSAGRLLRKRHPGGKKINTSRDQPILIL